MSKESLLNLKVFEMPEGYKNVFMMDAEEAAIYFNVDEDTADKILNSMCLSILENGQAKEREDLLSDYLSESEYQEYLNTGIYTIDGKTYNLNGVEI